MARSARERVRSHRLLDRRRRYRAVRLDQEREDPDQGQRRHAEAEMEARDRQSAARASRADAGAGDRAAEHRRRHEAGRHRQRHLRQPLRVRRRDRQDSLAEALGLSGAGGPRRRWWRRGADRSEAAWFPAARRQQRYAGDRSGGCPGPAAGVFRHRRRHAPHHQCGRRHRPAAALQVLWRQGLGAQPGGQYAVDADHLRRRLDCGGAGRRSRAQGHDLERRQRRCVGTPRRRGGLQRHCLDHHR